VVAGADRLTYAELIERADRLAGLLVSRGAAAERFVALALPRSVDLVVAMLAVLKSGAAYLPVDPDFPADRLAYLFAVARPVLLAATTAAFAIAALALFLPLLSGARVVLATKETVLDPPELARLRGAEQATIMQATPSLWQALATQAPQTLRGMRVLVGGEALP